MSGGGGKMSLLSDEEGRRVDRGLDQLEESGPGSERLSLDVFEPFSVGHTEISSPWSRQHVTFKKIEVVSARQINTLAFVFNLTAAVALVCSGTFIILSRTVFSQSLPDVPGAQPGALISILVYELPLSFIMFDSIMNFVVFTYVVLLLIFFCAVLLKEGIRNLLNEQIWVLMLVFGTMAYLNPYEPIVRLLRDFLGVDVPDSQAGFSYLDVFTCVRMLSFSTISLLYIWMTSHSYRYLTRRISFKDWKFYTPKIIIILLYNLFKLGVFFKYRIVVAELPMATIVAFFNLYASIQVWPRLAIVTVSLLTFFEIIVLGLILIDIRKTYRVLGGAKYIKHRTKILGFRFFLHQQGIFYIMYVSTYALVLFGLPKGVQILQFIILSEGSGGRGSYFDIQYAPLGLQLLILAYVTTEVYTNLPSSFVWRKLFFHNSRDHIENTSEPIVYRNTEPRSFQGDGRKIQANCFVMQTNIDLFNLAWFVYYHGTRKEGSLNAGLGSLRLKLKESLFDKETDTKAFVAASPDQIVIAFKGTTSKQNIVTDVKVLYRSLPQVIGPTRRKSPDAGEDDSRVSDIIHSSSFKRAKVHAGFVEAYISVKEKLMNVTEALLNEKDRPVYFTGHSLGGALATLASLDVSLTLDVPGNKILVTTFGSPRVGNKLFQEVYDSVIPMNWRVVAGGDIVSRLPKIGYEHVGRKVVLSTRGELFIDPSALEVIFWHSPPASIVHHKKSWYLLSLKSFCESQDSDYSHSFWPFPVSENDSRRFKMTRQKPTSSQLQPISRLERKSRGAARYREWADAIDALDIEIRDHQSLANWQRLTLRILENTAPEDIVTVE